AHPGDQAGPRCLARGLHPRSPLGDGPPRGPPVNRAETTANRTIVLLVEGDTERAACNHLKRFLDGRAGDRPKVRLQTSLFDGNRKPWGAQPENIDRDKPPAHRLWALFQEGKPPRKYKKPIDGRKLFEQLDVLEIAARCPEFRQLIECLLQLAGYAPLE